MKTAGKPPAVFAFLSYIPIMPAKMLYADIAVPGPLRRTFSYRIPLALDQIEPGCRVAVPLGNRAVVGFFIKYTSRPSGIRMKSIEQVLDVSSLYSRELFEFLIWMADYYFANPADCLAAALPPLLKRASQPDYFWSDNVYRMAKENFRSLPKEAAAMIHPGGKLSDADRKRLRAISPSLLKRMLDRSVVQPRWTESLEQNRQKLIGYMAEPNGWDDFFSRRRTSAELFNGVKSRIDLIESGWNDYLIRAAVKAGQLAAQYAESPSGMLEFIEAKEAVEQIELNKEQSRALDLLSTKLNSGYSTTLLHGVTGSGKTVVYCHLVRRLIESSKSALVLTPEIALTGSMLAYFRSFFADQVAVIHSSMTNRERYESWKGIREGRYKVTIGPRSALFAPINDLGLIIVDEEHDGSYKQDDPAPRFHGRDAAIMRGRMAGVPVVLGSASPSMESYHNAREGRYDLLTIKQRPKGAKLPVVRIVDMRKDRIRGDLSYLSHQLKQEIDRRLENDEQSILYLNRRGFAPMILCSECGHIPFCPQCQVRLTFHKVGKRLTCHYCGYINAAYNVCEKCKSADLDLRGVGTQKVEANLPRLFGESRTLRMDSDVAFGRRKAYDILQAFAKKEASILLGTQMVSKGLDLPEVTLVGVLQGDAGLDMPDFRAKEKAFARLLQVSGRCGRADKPGEVLIQTFDPENELITDAARQDYESFFVREIESRRAMHYPPFSRIVNFMLSSDNEGQLSSTMQKFHTDLLYQMELAKITPSVLGPAECPLYFLRGQYRRHLFVKTKQPVKLTKMLTKWEEAQSRFGLPASVKITIDVDPDSMM